MTVAVLITLSLLVLIAYAFDISASKTKIPSVILLLTLGFIVKITTNYSGIVMPDLSPILPILGTLGLILIVLEGSLELEINKDKIHMIVKSALVAFIPIILLSLGLAYFIYYYYNIPLKIALANAIPLAIISSAIAIPSAQNLSNEKKEFVTYESSISDIFGVILFNFFTLNDYIDIESIGIFSLQMVIMLIVSLVATLLLAGFLNKIKHHVKFIPMMVFLVLIYSIAKIFHLPSLIFILIFGLFVGNIDELRHIKFIQRFHPVNFSNDVHKFKEITTEIAFLIRSLFFILFGYLIDAHEVLNTDTLALSLSITVAIFIIRFVILFLFKTPRLPLLFIAPRGLITILLFLSIPISQQIPYINKSLIIQVIVLTAIIMMIGLMNFNEPISEDDKARNNCS